jgi:hypothetical protein
MPPEDPIFDTPPTTDPPAATPAPDKGNGAAAPAPAADTVALQAELGETKAALSQLTAAVQQILRDGMPTRQDPGPPEPLTADQTMADLAADPAGTIRRLAGEELTKKVGEELNPERQLLINTAHQMLVTTQQDAVDGQFGEGTWKEVILPEIQPDPPRPSSGSWTG